MKFYKSHKHILEKTWFFVCLKHINKTSFSIILSYSIAASFVTSCKSRSTAPQYKAKKAFEDKSCSIPAPSAPALSNIPLIGISGLYTPLAEELVKRDRPAGQDTVLQDLLARVDAANQSYKNSSVNQRLYISSVSVATTSSIESGDTNKDYNDVISRDDGFLDEFHELREASSGDIGVAILGKYNIGGKATLNILGRSESSYISVCLICTGTTLAHEIGHLQGAHHALAPESDFPYQKGYYVEGKFRTIMANSCSSDGSIECLQQLYWSNPNTVFEGEPTGDSSHNNARVLNESAHNMAAIKNPANSALAKIFGSRATYQDIPSPGFIAVKLPNSNSNYPGADFRGENYFFHGTLDSSGSFRVQIPPGFWRVDLKYLNSECEIVEESRDILAQPGQKVGLF